MVSSKRAVSDRESSLYKKMLKRRNRSEKNARKSAVSCARKLRSSLRFDVPVSSSINCLMGFGSLDGDGESRLPGPGCGAPSLSTRSDSGSPASTRPEFPSRFGTEGPGLPVCGPPDPGLRETPPDASGEEEPKVARYT